MGHLSRPGKFGVALRVAGAEISKFRFLDVVSPDPRNIRAKCHRRRPSGLGALGFRKMLTPQGRTDGRTDALHLTSFISRLRRDY